MLYSSIPTDAHESGDLHNTCTIITLLLITIIIITCVIIMLSLQ